MKLIQNNSLHKYKILFDNDADWQIVKDAHIPGLIVWNNKKGCNGEIGAIVSALSLLKSSEFPRRNEVVVPLNLPINQLRNYQLDGIGLVNRNLKDLGCSILGDEMGLGKSRESIAVASTIPGRKLLLVPASVRSQWASEIETLFGENTEVSVITPYVHSRMKAGKEETFRTRKYEWIITSYDLADKIYDFCFQEGPPNILIMDEAHNLRGRGKGHGNIRTKAIKDIAAQINYKLAITGTPIWDRPRDLWMLFEILGVKLSRWDFDIRYCNGRINDFGGMDNWGSSNEAELKHRLSYYLVRRTKKEVAAELPPLTRTVEWLDPVKECTDAWRSSLVHPGPRGLSKALLASHAAKLERTVELAVQAGKSLIFTYRKDHAYYLEERLKEADIKVMAITGDMTPEARNSAIILARKEESSLVCTIDSVGTGVNLQNIATVGIVHALSWEPNKLLQMEGRPHRIDTHEPFQWIYLAVKESADEHVINTVISKLQTWQDIMGMGEGDKGLKDVLSDNLNNDDLNKQVMRSIFDNMEVNFDD